MISASVAKPLARALQNVVPVDADAQEKAAAKVVVERGDAIDLILNQRQDVATIRAELLKCMNAWGGMYDALVATTRLAGTAEKPSATASKVIEKIFPDGVMFIRLEAPAAWAEADRRWKRIVELGLEGDIGDVIGKHYVDSAKKTTFDLGDAIGIGRVRREAPSKTALADALFDFSRAVSRYARVLSAKVHEEDASSVERFRKAVAPIDEYRSTRKEKGVEDGEEEEPGVDGPSTPVVPVVTDPSAPGGPNSPFIEEPTNG